MGKFTYTDHPEMERGSSLDPIIHSASIEVLSATKKPETIEYACRLTDLNIPETVTFALTVHAQERRVLHVEKRTTPVTPDLVTPINIQVWIVIGNDLGELCYGLQVDDPWLGRRVEFDLDFDADGTLGFTHRWWDDPDAVTIA